MIDVEMIWDQDGDNIMTRPHLILCIVMIPQDQYPAVPLLCLLQKRTTLSQQSTGRPLLGYQHHSPGRLRQWQQRKTLIVIKQQQAVLDLCPWKTVVVMLVTSPCRNSSRWIRRTTQYVVAEKMRRTQDTDHGSADALFSFSIINSGCVAFVLVAMVMRSLSSLVMQNWSSSSSSCIPWNWFQVVGDVAKDTKEGGVVTTG